MEKHENNKYLFLMRWYNEAHTIKESLQKVSEAWYHKIIFVNDGSTDNTKEIIKLFQIENPFICIVYLEHTINRGRGGWGAALKTWFWFIKQNINLLDIDRIVTFDPDGQMDIKDMKYFKKSQKDNPECKLFLGSRFVQWSETINMPATRKVILALSRLSTRWLYQTKVSDPHCWYRVIHKETLPLLEIQADSMHYANEINESINKHSIAYQEVPVTITYTEHSLSKGQQNGNSIALWIQMLYKKFFFR
jgi:glycosyltransferase involved in cell wall biosynthesis